MPYMGPGPAVIGKAEYDRLVKFHEDTADGRIGSAVLGDLTLAPAPTPEPVEAVTPVEWTKLHVQTCLKMLRDATREECAAWHALESARDVPRPTLLAALAERLA